MPTEVEARFRADGPDPLDALTAVPRLGHALLGPARTADVLDRYLDTANGALASARWACRLRERAGAIRVSLKGPAREQAADGWRHSRPEVEGPATASVDPADWPPSAARTKLRSLVGPGRLAERLHLRQRRTERSVALDGAAELGILSLDRVRMGAGERDLGELFIVELELHEPSAPAEAALDAMAAALSAVPGLTPEPRTKLELALGRLGGAS
jgi:inorganic triphosphatase YgiF